MKAPTMSLARKHRRFADQMTQALRREGEVCFIRFDARRFELLLEDGHVTRLQMNLAT